MCIQNPSHLHLCSFTVKPDLIAHVFDRISSLHWTQPYNSMGGLWLSLLAAPHDISRDVVGGQFCDAHLCILFIRTITQQQVKQGSLNLTNSLILTLAPLLYTCLEQIKDHGYGHSIIKCQNQLFCNIYHRLCPGGVTLVKYENKL